MIDGILTSTEPESVALCRVIAKSLRLAADDVDRAGDGDSLRIGMALARLEELTPRLAGLSRAAERSRVRERESA